MRFIPRFEASGPGDEASSHQWCMKQAAVWPLVHTMRFPAILLGANVAELGACPAGNGFCGVRPPFRPERIA